MPRFYVNGYQGGGKNHLRWLLMLSDRYDMTIESDNVLQSKNQKLIWIKKAVYPKDRHWHKWMNFEDRYRFKYDHLIALPSVNEHALWHDEDPDSRSIAMIVDPCICEWKSTFLQTYRSQEEGLRYNDKMREHASKDKRILLLEADSLHDDGILDPRLLKKAADWFDLEDIYDKAAIVHDWWRLLQQRAESEYKQTIKKVLDAHP